MGSLLSTAIKTAASYSGDSSRTSKNNKDKVVSHPDITGLQSPNKSTTHTAKDVNATAENQLEQNNNNETSSAKNKALLESLAASEDKNLVATSTAPLKRKYITTKKGTRKKSRNREATSTAQLKSKDKTTSKRTPKYPFTKTAVNTSKPQKWKWTEAADQLLREAVEKHTKKTNEPSKSPLLHDVRSLAMQWGIPDPIAFARCEEICSKDLFGTNANCRPRPLLAKVLPVKKEQQLTKMKSGSSNRSKMTQEGDMRLWEGHCMFGNKWKQINKKYFESARCGESLRIRWKTQEFQDFIRSKFGSVAYQIENERTDHSAKKASNAANKSSPPTKKARKEYNWSEAEDQIISKTAAQYRKDGVVGDPLWRTLAKQFGVSPLCVYKRWMNKLNPDLDRSGMTPQDDMHLWEGHCMFGNKWEQINKKYFESARWGEHLRQRWTSPGFQDFIRSKFGPNAYQSENERTDHSAKRASNAAHGSSPPTKKARKEYNWSKAQDQIISKTVAQYRKDGVVGDPLWTKLAKQFGVPYSCVYRRWMGHLNHDLDRSKMTPQDDMRLWKGHCMFGKKWQQISDEYFESTRWGEHLRHRWRSREFQDFIRNKFGLDVYQAENEAIHHFDNGHNLPANDSMDRFSNDILYRIASFVPSLGDLLRFCSTSKQSHLIMEDEFLSEKLYRGLFLKRFGAKELGAYHCSWKERLICNFDFKRALKGSKDPQVDRFAIWPHTVGVIQPEESAILYDNPDYDFYEDSSPGYFGLQSLNLDKPPNASHDWESPFILRGDFNGIRLFKSLGALKDHSNANRFTSLGDDEEGGQVLTLILNDNIDQGTASPCCFLGYASGRVSAMTCCLTEDGTEYVYTLFSWHAHSSEVTSLAIAQNPRPILISASCNGDVYYYPSSTQAVKAFSYPKKCPILCMTCTEVTNREGKLSSIIITGDQSGTIRLVSANLQENIFFSICSKKGCGKHPVTVVKNIIHDGVKLLVTGNRNGDVQFWSIDMNKCLNPMLNLVRQHRGIHSGAVEMCRMIAGVLVTSGGNDGKLIGFDPSSCRKIGTLLYHRGKSVLLPDGTRRQTMISCAVSALMLPASRRKLITLCRDGTMADWTFGAAE